MAHPLPALPSPPAAFASLSKDTATGLNLLKKGSDPPLKPDSEYPDWLWTLVAPEKTLGELKRQGEASLTLEDVSGGRVECGRGT